MSNKKIPMVSIIVPIYNVEKYLNRCIDSILNQTFTDFELILINDGSTDKSGDICDKYKKIDDRVTVIHKENEGVSATRNHGINLARGSYILFADSDDYVNKKWISRLYYELKYNNECELSICGFEVDQKANINNTEILYDNLGKDITISSSEFWELRKKGILNSVWNKMFILDVLNNNNIRFNENLSLAEDLIFVLDYISKIKCIRIINSSLYNYRIEYEDSLSQKYYSSLFYIHSLIFHKLKYVSEQLEINIDTYKANYYNDYLAALLRTLDNTMNIENSQSFYKKLIENNKILKSNEFQDALENCNMDNYNKYFIMALKSKRYIVFYLFNKIYNCKVKFCNLLR